MHLRGPPRLRDGSALRSAPNASYALQTHFPVKEYVASLAMVRDRRLRAPPRRRGGRPARRAQS